MAEYYGKLSYTDKGEKKGRLKRAGIISLIAVNALFIVICAVGIFGDTERRDETRAIISENTELKQSVIMLTEENEKLTEEIEELKNTLKSNSIEAGTTLTKPEGDLSENALQGDETTEGQGENSSEDGSEEN